MASRTTWETVFSAFPADTLQAGYIGCSQSHRNDGSSPFTVRFGQVSNIPSKLVLFISRGHFGSPRW